MVSRQAGRSEVNPLNLGARLLGLDPGSAQEPTSPSGTVLGTTILLGAYEHV